MTASLSGLPALFMAAQLWRLQNGIEDLHCCSWLSCSHILTPYHLPSDCLHPGMAEYREEVEPGQPSSSVMAGHNCLTLRNNCLVLPSFPKSES